MRPKPPTEKMPKTPTSTDEAVETMSPNKKAVALEYRPKTPDDAPKIRAKGRGYVAQKIIDTAFAHDVPVIQHADMAEMLSALDVETEIPPEAFVAVAEILRYIYDAKGTPLPSFDN